MTILQLIYASQPFGFDEAMLGGILVSARRNNPKYDITGCLIVRHDLYLQLLEGPEVAVDALYERITVDNRHLDVRCLVRETVDARMFPDWAMRDDPAQSWLWSPEEVGNGALTTATSSALRAVFERVTH
jgi:Sensors of blue-light using FAD